MSKSRSTPIIMMVMIAMFAAISYVVLLFRIPVATQMVHAGNAVCILAALLLGGWQGGLAGSMGMGLFDLVFWPSSMVKTIILKFFMGLFAGLVFGIYKKRGSKPEKTAPHIALFLASAVTLLLAVSFFAGGAPESNAWYACGFLAVLGVCLLITLIFSVTTKKLSAELLYAVLGATAGVAFNVAGEFVWNFTTYLLQNYTANAAVISTLTDIPATFINGSFSVFLAVLLYVPLKKIMEITKLSR